jgi:predicted molibdopterin-dependent oxidoreductase YjgC
METIIINDTECSFSPGETILEVAERNHIDIPQLCHLAGTTPTGTCRVCVVEVAGRDDLMTACSTEVEPDMMVQTESRRVIKARCQTIAEMLSSGNHNCAISGTSGKDWTQFQLGVQEADEASALCPAWGDCRLQDLAYHYQVTGGKPGNDGAPYPMERVNPFIIRDFSRCILCGRCVKACNEVQVNRAIDYSTKADGVISKIIAADDKPLAESECVFCGECVQVCPVGALVEKDARFDARPWETEKVRTTCSYCGVGCQMYLHVQDGVVKKVTGVEGVPPNYGSLCVKGRFGFNFIHSDERLTAPLIKKDGAFQEVSWDEATRFVADKFKDIQQAHGADSLGLLTSARVTNEENYLAHKFARAVLKTNNIDHCARL